MGVKPEVRARVLAKYPECLACGSTKRLCVDHVAPIYRGGTDDESNLQTLCSRCNTLKAGHVVDLRTQRINLSAYIHQIRNKDITPLSLDLPTDLYRSIEARAAVEDRTFNAEVVRALRATFLPPKQATSDQQPPAEVREK
jgi:hypothetical protein